MSTIAANSTDLKIGAKVLGKRIKQHRDAENQLYHLLKASAKITINTFFTESDAGWAQNFTSVTGTHGRADLSQGVYWATTSADNTGGSNGDVNIACYGPGTHVEVDAADGVQVGDFVELDLGTQSSAVTETTSVTRNKVKKISYANAHSATAGVGVIGRVLTIGQKGTDGIALPVTDDGEGIVTVRLRE